MNPWDAQFAERSPMFAPLAGLCAELPRACWPSTMELNALAARAGVANGNGKPLRFAAWERAHAGGAADYELQTWARGVVPLRASNWHDLFNAFTWLTWPRAKAAINRGHRDALATQTGAQRGTMRDALTLFDENGAIVLSSEPAVLDAIRTFRWKELFYDGRARFMRTTRVLLFGHALYEKALAPYVGMTAHALLFGVDANTTGLALREQVLHADALGSTRIAQGLNDTRELAPLPVLGVPGWWPDNEHAAFYDNDRYFRPGRGRARG